MKVSTKPEQDHKADIGPIARYLLPRQIGPASLLRADGRYVDQRVRRDHAVSRKLGIGFSQDTATFGNVGIRPLEQRTSTLVGRQTRLVVQPFRAPLLC